MGGVFGAAFRWVGGIVSATTDLIGASVRGAFSILVGAVSGGITMLAGIVTLDFGLFAAGLLELANRTIGALLVAGGKIVSLVQTILTLEPRKRRLTETELRYLRLVFRNTVNLFNVRVVVGNAGVFMNTDRPFTLGNTIYMKDTDEKAWDHVLVHECVHVWQYQNVGPRYSSEALFAQKFLGNDRAYNSRNAPGRADAEDASHRRVPPHGRFLRQVVSSATISY